MLSASSARTARTTGALLNTFYPDTIVTCSDDLNNFLTHIYDLTLQLSTIGRTPDEAAVACFTSY
jgi:hypothetical protein